MSELDGVFHRGVPKEQSFFFLRGRKRRSSWIKPSFGRVVQNYIPCRHIARHSLKSLSVHIHSLPWNPARSSCKRGAGRLFCWDNDDPWRTASTHKPDWNTNHSCYQEVSGERVESPWVDGPWRCVLQSWPEGTRSGGP
jgi:hypothetical protein